MPIQIPAWLQPVPVQKIAKPAKIVNIVSIVLKTAAHVEFASNTQRHIAILCIMVRLFFVTSLKFIQQHHLQQ